MDRAARPQELCRDEPGKVGRRQFLRAGCGAAVAAALAPCTSWADRPVTGGHALTVNGPVPAASLGVTLPHEHLLMDFSVRYAPVAGEDEVRAPLKLEDRWRLVRHPAAHRINLLNLDVENAIQEAMYFRAAGGQTIVDLTPAPLTPGPDKLKTISARTGLNVIAATGYYVDASLPEWARTASVDALADRLVNDIENGGKERIRRGAIGEIAIETATDLELRCVRAAGRAQRRTGAPCYFHVMSGILPAYRAPVERIFGSYLDEGGDPKRLVICHQDGAGDDPDYQLGLLRRGFHLEYDTFGSEGVFAFGDKYIQLPTDTRRIKELKVLVDAGFAGQLLISQDVSYQVGKRTWGGWGMAHILDTLWPRFLAEGISEPVLRSIMHDNPARLLGFASA
jgi:phosphotriesterase-related protein